MSVINITWIPAVTNSTGQIIDYKKTTDTAWITFATVGNTVNSASIPITDNTVSYNVRITNICVYGNAPGPIVTVTPTPVTTYTYVHTATFQKNNCTAGTGSSISYSESYSSTISIADAQSKSDADAANFNTRGQADVNSIGNCVDDAERIGILLVDVYNTQAQGYNIVCFIDDADTTIVHQTAYTGSNFLPNDGTPAANCYILASDKQGNDQIEYRFEVNLTKLVNDYPSKTSFTIKIKGYTPQNINKMTGVYAIKATLTGAMTMIGSPGTYIPSVSTGTASIGDPISYVKPVQIIAGATYIGYPYGQDIMVFTFNVAANTLTLA